MPESLLPEGSVIRRTIHFHGRVQGVGFRQTTVEIASRFDVTGHVRNLPDGRVQLVAEGAIDTVAAFQRAIESRMAANIREVEVADSPPSGEFADFRIAW